MVGQSKDSTAIKEQLITPDFFAVQHRTLEHNRQYLPASMIAGFIQKLVRIIRDIFEQSDSRCINPASVAELGIDSRFAKSL
jgi:hypothetical protein